MTALRIAYDAFTGSDYASFVLFAKRALKAMRGVVTVVYLQGYKDAGDRGVLAGGGGVAGWVPPGKGPPMPLLTLLPSPLCLAPNPAQTTIMWCRWWA